MFASVYLQINRRRSICCIRGTRFDVLVPGKIL